MTKRSETVGPADSRPAAAAKASEHRPHEAQTPSANHFIKVHESHIPWKADDPVFHEDERYETLAGAKEERVPGIFENFRILHGADDCDVDLPGGDALTPQAGESEQEA